MSLIPIGNATVVETLDQFKTRLDVDIVEIIHALDAHHRHRLAGEVLETYNEDAEETDWQQADTIAEAPDGVLETIFEHYVDVQDSTVIHAVLKQRDSERYVYDIDTRGRPTLHRIYTLTEPAGEDVAESAGETA